MVYYIRLCYGAQTKCALIHVWESEQAKKNVTRVGINGVYKLHHTIALLILLSTSTTVPERFCIGIGI